MTLRDAIAIVRAYAVTRGEAIVIPQGHAADALLRVIAAAELGADVAESSFEIVIPERAAQ